jgi:hypothetical protein
VVDVSSVDERFGALKFSLFAEDNKKAKSFVLRASAEFYSRFVTNHFALRRELLRSSARISGYWAFLTKTVRNGVFCAKG